jgi:alkylation response protein AidB-like acyl-CoA dehydrogenase
MAFDFSVTDEQGAMLQAVERFLERRLPPLEVRRRDAQHVPPYDLLPDLASLGVLGLVAPASWGGLGQDWVTLSLVQERLAAHAYFIGSIVNRVVGFGLMTMLNHGSAAQQQRWIPPLVQGRGLMALALTESQAGSDVGAVQTRAVVDGDGWCIHGRKVWISDADGAMALLVVARTDAQRRGTRGLSVFIVPRESEGITMTPLPKAGNHAMPSWDIGLDSVRVGPDALLGPLHEGMAVLGSTLHYSRASLAATCLGCAQSVVSQTLAHVRERQQFGKPLGSFQVVRHRLADMQMRVDPLRWVVRHLAWLIATGQPCAREASQAKVLATEVLQDLSNQAMQLFASQGYADDSDIQRIWRDARLYTFGEGTNEVQRDLIARHLGL